MTKPRNEDLTPTALYTAEVWSRGRFAFAELFGTRESRAVYRVVQCVLAFMRLFNRKLPRLKEGLIQRHRLFDILAMESRATAIVEIAAGFSTRGLRTLAERPTVRYIETDLAPVIHRKRSVYKTHYGNGWPANHILVECDLQVLNTEVLPPLEGETDWIAEGILMYLSPPERRALMESVLNRILHGRGGRFMFDLLPGAEEPPPGPLGRFLGWCMRAITRGGDFNRAMVTREDIYNDLLDAGFQSVDMVDPAEATGLFPGVATRQLVFVAKAATPPISAPTRP